MIDVKDRNICDVFLFRKNWNVSKNKLFEINTWFTTFKASWILYKHVNLFGFLKKGKVPVAYRKTELVFQPATKRNYTVQRNRFCFC